jgi:hypothetical protein
MAVDIVPGQAAGTALAGLLFGDFSPSGRLPVTFYRSVSQLPPFTDYGLHRDPDGSLAKKATRETYAVANFALHRANELKLERKRGK